jgi:hypothetical protein
MRSSLPGRSLDVLVDLASIEWYKNSLLSGRIPSLWRDVHYPVGIPPALLAPMPLQALIDIPLSLVFHDNILCYNFIWYASFLFTGLASFRLTWELLPSRIAAMLAGLLLMLSAPFVSHAFGKTELLPIGVVPLFLWAWMRFIDRPGGRSLLASLGAYGLVAASCIELVVTALAVAIAYGAWRAARAGSQDVRGWLGDRWPSLAVFACAALLGAVMIRAHHAAAPLSGGSFAEARWFARQQPPAMPRAYTEIVRRDPDATFLEVPQTKSGSSRLNAACGYWQSLHHGKTSAGYARAAHETYDDLLGSPTSFAPTILSDPGFATAPEAAHIDLQPNVSFPDYAWLFLSVHNYGYVVLHEWPGAWPAGKPDLARWKTLLSAARLYEDGQIAVYARSLMQTPTRPTLLCTAGWRARLPGSDGLECVVAKRAKLAVFNPNAAQPVLLTIEAQAFRRTRWVRLRSGAQVLARWQVKSDGFELHASPAFLLSAGIHELIVESASEDAPCGRTEKPVPGDSRPYSLIVRGVSLRAAPIVAPAQTAAYSSSTWK